MAHPPVSNRIHPTAVIGAGVDIGHGNVIGPYSVLLGPCRIGDGNWIGPHVTIGTPAEHLDGPHPVGWEDEQAGHGVEIGDRNRVREHVSIHQGIDGATTVGDYCYLQARSHLGHDSHVADDVTLACSVQLGAYTHVWSHVSIGLGALVQQFGVIGPGAMIGMGAAVCSEVPPFTVSFGNPARTVGVHEAGLRRLGCTDEMIAALAPVIAAGITPSDVDVPVDVAGLLKLWADRDL
jgi:UDP-N-acetylglucosamine acyltransferase